MEVAAQEALFLAPLGCAVCLVAVKMGEQQHTRRIRGARAIRLLLGPWGRLALGLCGCSLAVARWRRN